MKIHPFWLVVAILGCIVGGYKIPREPVYVNVPMSVYIGEKEKKCQQQGGEMEYYTSSYTDKIVGYKCVSPKKEINLDK